MTDKHRITVQVNGAARTGEVESRRTLVDFLRDDCALTGTHVGCEHGVCGACTVIVDGEPIRSCLMFAVQADGSAVTTVEGVAPGDGAMHAIQDAFWESHSFQCGFCTPGFVMTTQAFLAENASPTEDEIRAALAGNLCRCTGYQSIVAGVAKAAESLAQQA